MRTPFSRNGGCASGCLRSRTERAGSMDPPDVESPALHVVVLAAGASSRFGSPKQLVRIQGRPLLHRAVASAVELAGHAVTVVLGAHAAELTPLLRHTPASILINRDWDEGI